MISIRTTTTEYFDREGFQFIILFYLRAPAVPVIHLGCPDDFNSLAEQNFYPAASTWKKKTFIPMIQEADTGREEREKETGGRTHG